MTEALQNKEMFFKMMDLTGDQEIHLDLNPTKNVGAIMMKMFWWACVRTISFFFYSICYAMIDYIFQELQADQIFWDFFSLTKTMLGFV